MPDINRIGADSAGSYQRTQRTRYEPPTSGSGGAGSTSGTGNQSDSVSLSASAQELQQITALVMDSSDVRDDVVSALQAQLQNGTYQLPSDEELAESMLSGG